MTAVEEILTRELRDVADNLTVPDLPPLPATAPPPPPRGWQPLLVAAVVVLIIGGAIAMIASYRSEGEPEPAPPPPTQGESSPEVPQLFTTEPPSVPWLWQDELHVDGAVVPGSGWWPWTPVHAGDAWLAQRGDLTWLWGTDAEPHTIEGGVKLRARLSPDGRLLAAATTVDGGTVVLIETATGSTLATLPIDMTDPRGDGPGVVAVTDDGLVFLSGDGQITLWRATEGGGTVDLGDTAPNQSVEAATPAGLVVHDQDRDGESDAAYLAEPTAAGELERIRDLPTTEVVVNPAGTWLAYGGSQGGESATDPQITAESVDGEQTVTLAALDDRTMFALAWETDDLLLAELDSPATGLARCSIREERCVEIETP